VWSATKHGISDELFVIHTMELRDQFRARYLEAKKW